MKNTILSLKILHLFLLYLSLFCSAHVTAQSSPSFIEATDIFTLLNYESDIPIFLQQFIDNHSLSQVICTDPPAINSSEDNQGPLEDGFSKLSSFLRQLGIENSNRNENIINELINNSKVYYMAYRATEPEDLDSENTLLFQNQENLWEDYSHSKKKSSQIYLQPIDVDDAFMEIASRYKEIGLICIGVENIDTFPSLILESTLEFLKRGNNILLPISASDPASSPLDHQLIASLSQDIYTETVSANPNVMRRTKDYKDASIILMDLEKTEPLTTENTEISSYSTPIASDVSAKPFIKTALRTLRSLDGTPPPPNQHANSNSNLTTWIVVVVVVGVILLLGVIFTVLAYLKRRNKNRQQPQSATSAAAGHPAQRVRQETTVNTVHNNRAMTGEEATLAPHSPPVLRVQQEFMNSEEDMEDPMQENFPCFNTPVRVDDVLRLFEIHFEGYKDSKGGEGHQCAICYDAKKTIMFSPCAHICACEPCAQEVMNTFGKCPLCRTQIEELTYVVKGAS